MFTLDYRYCQNCTTITTMFHPHPLSFLFKGEHHIHLYWSGVPVEYSPLLAFCPGPPLPVDASQVIVVGEGRETARATVMAHFIVDGRKAGPGEDIQYMLCMTDLHIYQINIHTGYGNYYIILLFSC